MTGHYTDAERLADFALNGDYLDETAWLHRRLEAVLLSRQAVIDRVVTIELARIAEFCREHTSAEVQAHVRGRIAEIRGQVAS